MFKYIQLYKKSLSWPPSMIYFFLHILQEWIVYICCLLIFLLPFSSHSQLGSSNSDWSRSNVHCQNQWVIGSYGIWQTWHQWLLPPTKNSVLSSWHPLWSFLLLNFLSKYLSDRPFLEWSPRFSLVLPSPFLLCILSALFHPLCSLQFIWRCLLTTDSPAQVST